MKSQNHKYALILMAAVAMTATDFLSTAYAQQVSDGMDGYVVGIPTVVLVSIPVTQTNVGMTLMMMASQTCTVM